MSSMLVPILLGVTVIALIGGIGLFLVKSPGAIAEERLDGLGGRRAKAKRDLQATMLLRPETLTTAGSWKLAATLADAEWMTRLYEQADVNLPINTFLAIVAVLAGAGGVGAVLMKMPIWLAPAAAAGLGLTPFLWLVRRKKARIAKIIAALPEAMELMARALKAGHGLASGMNLVSEEMVGPIGQEFGRVFEEQNFGIPLDVSLRGMAERVPSMDVRFFVTAVVIQRGTGGDLAEVLEKIGKLVRQRFELHGHVKALTAEGRLSGIVLLALPPALLAFLQCSNPSYVGALFTTALGTKMLGAAVVMQILGAVSIKKIVAIKV